MDAIVAVEKNWGIGLQGELLVSNPVDMKYFREMTREKVVVMGRKTLESFPGGRPLKKRVNVVLSASMPESESEEAGTRLVFRKTVEGVLSYIEDFPPEQVFLIGGGSVYRRLLPYCSRAYVTRMENEYEADTFFPNLDEEKHWHLAEEGERREYGEIEFRFCVYERED